ncbi:MAG TPA: tetratricopeptide repeat protein [Pirellulales bacterium]|nr:tetratricopeptide repeat protein [Pirellulales bacterium]
MFFCAVVAIPAARAFALDRDLAYLHALESPSRGHGDVYGDVAVNYLETMEKTGTLSPALHEVFDLEMSKALRAEAQNPPDPSQRGALLSRSQKYLDEFVKNNPNHPEALQAQITSAEMLFDHAQETIAAARNNSDKAEREAALLQARNELAQVKAILQPSVEKLLEQLKALGPRPTRILNRQVVLKDRAFMTHKEKEQEAKRVDLDFDLIRTSGELAIVDYYRAQTFDPSPTSKQAAERKLALSTSAKSLDAYYQLHRGDDPISQLGRSGFIGALNAHTWYGKAVDELGASDQAKDIYDEVLENFPDTKDANTGRPALPSSVEKNGLEPVLARAKYFALQLLVRNPKSQKEYQEEAEEFINNPVYKKLFFGEWGYEAASFDLANWLLTTSEKETNTKDKAAEIKEALALLKDVSTVRSEFQDAAAQKRLKFARGVNPTNVDDALEFFKLAFKDKDWEKAEALLQTALDLLKKDTKRKEPEIKALQGQIQDWLAECRLQPIREDFIKSREPFKPEKYQAWLEAAQKVAQESKTSVIAPQAASMADYCAAVLYGKTRNDEQQARTAAAKKSAAEAKTAAYKQFQDLTDFITASFPNSPEADEARLSLGKAKWLDGNVAEAITTFQSITPKSEKYPEAMRLLGELGVEQFQTELKKPADKQNPQLTEKYRLDAIKALTESVKEQLSLLKPNDPIPSDLIKSELLLGQVHMEGKEYAEAVKVLQPLIDSAYAAKGSAGLDETMLKIFSSAVRAYMAMDDFQKAGKAGNVLIDLGPDRREVNVVLVDFVRRLDIELKELREKLDKLADASPAETEALRNRISAIKDMLGTMVGKLASRKELGAKSMIYLGTLYSDVDDYDDAEKQYKALLARADSDPDFKQEAAPSFLWVRGQLVDLLGKRGKLDEATAEIAKLRKERPNNLDFMVVEAKLWQEWGQKDPARYDTAVQKWTEIRRRLQHQPGKAGAAIYYDSVYNAAFSYFMEANKLALNPGKKGDAVKKIQDAQKILKSELIPNPKLDGPDSIKRFKGLQADLDKMLKRLQPSGEA